MLVGFNSYMSNNRNQKTSFGSFPVPKDFGESQALLDDVGMGLIKQTPDNIESLKTAFKQGHGTIKFHLKEIVEHWGLNLNDFIK